MNWTHNRRVHTVSVLRRDPGDSAMATYRHAWMTFASAVVVLMVQAAPRAGSALAQDEKLGKVTFPTSCDPRVQTDFQRGVAMLHSFWFNYARKTFEGVLQRDSGCAIAYWGIALDLLGNTFSTPPSRAYAQTAWDALERARA